MKNQPTKYDAVRSRIMDVGDRHSDLDYLLEICDAARKVRRAQSKYFKSRKDQMPLAVSRELLTQAQRAEGELDKLLFAPAEAGLFDE